MSNQFNSVAEINAEKESWRIMVRVVRLWMVSDVSTQKQTSASKIPFSMEMVLVDSKGDRVHGSVKRTLIYKFENSLQEGKVYSIQFFGVADNGGIYRTTHHKYKIVFQYPTKVALVDNATIPDSLYDFVPIRDIVGGGYDSDYLVDVMGILTGVGTERENEKNGRKTKMNVIQIEADGFSIECTLFGPFVDELNAFLASGEVENAAVIVHLAKVKCFQDKIHLQNCIYGTRVLFKAECEEVKQFAKRMLESPSQGLSQLTDSAALSMSDDFLYNTPKKTIADLKDCFEDTSYAIFGTVKHVVDDEEWWYTACTCNKSVYPDSKMFFCEKCNKHVTNVVLRYRIKVRVIDQSDSATFVIFDRDATILFNKSCANMFETYQKRGLGGTFPKEITNLVDKSFLFKVEVKNACNSQFEKSFRVKKICSDLSIIKLFKEGLADNTSLIQAQDLMPKFSDVVENDSQCGEKEAIDLSKDSEELTPTKDNMGSKSVLGGLTLNESQSATQNKGIDIFVKDSEDLTPADSICGAQLELENADKSKDLKELKPDQTHCITKGKEASDMSNNSENVIDVPIHVARGKIPAEVDVPLKVWKKKIKIEKS